ncbi:O-antigen ligase family protein [Aeromicrobium endophyticum]|uniref:O-antigen ligase domain-containing protein n=1 Tax=Aeromicrobium endophyticum TaxID=2292704 RepID=A0A371PBW4_9ACTN|nr:O-antigen ligase family protein [Aeromicrobium endophyticum]REK73434.1 O-antigen ligase domain-containing protein [Aeromicrobium endophyticum]
MLPAARTLQRPDGRAARVVPRVGRTLVAPAVVVLVLALLLPLALGSVFGAVVALGAAVLMLALVTFGIESTAIGLLALGFVLAPMNDVRPVAALTFVTMSDVFLVLSIGLLLPILVTGRFERQALFLVGAAGVVGLGLVTSVAGDHALASLNGLLRLLVGALMLPVTFMLWRPRRNIVTLLAAAYVLGNSISVLQAVASGLVSYEGRAIGLTRHPNILGLCSMLALTLIPFLLQELPRWSGWIVLAAAGVCGYGVWISGSRAALLVAVAMVAVYLVLSRSVERGLLLFGASIVPVYLVGRTLSSGDVGNNILNRFVGGGSASASDLAREQLVREAVERFLSSPVLGVGFADALEAHNIYLQVAASGGVAGLAFYLVLLASVVRQPLRLPSRYRLLALPAFGYVLVGFITPLLWDRYIWCLLALPFLMSVRGEADDSAPSRNDALQETA